jgi:hypothetical protein
MKLADVKRKIIFGRRTRLPLIFQEEKARLRPFIITKDKM